LDLTNKLYKACLKGEAAAKAEFADTLHEAVDYVRFHFTAEEKILEQIHYPGLPEHKKQHAEFVKEVMEGAKKFQDGKSFVPNNFVRFLKEWILAHIAVSDQRYGEYIENLHKKGTLTGTL
jgi:hemerythrin